MSKSTDKTPALAPNLQKVLDLATETATAQKAGADSSEAKAALQTKVTKDGKTTSAAETATVALASSTDTVDADPDSCGLCGAEKPAKPAKKS